MVFPALIWAAFRFGPPGATLSIAITAGVAIGVTASDAGPFSQQAIDHRTLSTQLYIAVAALTTLFLTAVVSERERSSSDLAEARRTEGERAVEERRRIARDLHDTVSQALSRRCSTPARRRRPWLMTEAVLRARRTIPQRDRGAHQERAERDTRAHLRIASRPGPRRLVAALARHASGSAVPACRPSTFGAGAAPRALAGRGNPALRNRAGGSCECPQARRGHAALVQVEAHVGHIVIGPRQRPGVRPRRRKSRPLRSGLDAQPRDRDRRATHDHEHARPRHGRPGSGPGGDEWRLTSSSRPATRASAC